MANCYKTFVFTLLCGLFILGEHAIKGLWRGEGFAGGLGELFGKRKDELLANSLVVFVAFIPYFGVKELGRVLGKDKIGALFFKNREGP